MDTQLSQRRFVCSWAIVLTLLVLAAGATAQAPAKPSARARPTSDPYRGFGVNASEGALWGGGADFKVRFGRDAVEFTPALGRAAEHDLPFVFQTLSFGRGADESAVAAAEPSRVGPAGVEYDRGPGIIEHHDVRESGLELSFVFAQRPAGAGDLIVRLRVESELRANQVADGLHFERAGLGGVGVGRVTGIDAQGRTGAGAMRLAGDVLELSLPAGFVDAAAFPLELDPFIYPVIFVAPDPIAEEGEPDVAYEDTGDRYLVVWEKAYSLSDFDIRGQFIDSAGIIDPSGYWFIEVASNTVATHPVVEEARFVKRFMVVWEQRPTIFGLSDLYGRSISTAGFGASAIIPIAAGSADEVQPDLGGFFTIAPWDAVPVVWAENGNIMDMNIFVLGVGDPFIQSAPATTLATGDCGSPSINKGGGNYFVYLVAYTRFHSSPFPGHHDIEAVIAFTDGSVGAGPIPLTATVGADERAPDVDGEGSTFFTVFGRAPSLFDSNQSVHSTRLYIDPFTGLISWSESTIDDSLGVPLDAREPSVAYTGDGALVAWSKQYSGTDYDIALAGLDWWGNTIADPISYADFETTFAHLPKVCARRASWPDLGDQAMVTWQVTYTNGDDDVRASLVDPEMGIITDLGGGTGGFAYVSAATVGNQGFTQIYDGLGQYPFNNVTLIIGLAPLNLPFCTGVLVPDPLLFLSFVTDANDLLVVQTPLPPDPILLGVTFYEQYAESDTVNPPCGKKIQLSNGLAILIE